MKFKANKLWYWYGRFVGKLEGTIDANGTEWVEISPETIFAAFCIATISISIVLLVLVK